MKDYISKKQILRFLLFFIMMGGAFLFDTFHQNDSQVPVKSEKSSHATGQDIFFICSPTITFSLKAPVHKVVFKKHLQQNIDRQLMLHHSTRAFHILKAEDPELAVNFNDRNVLALQKYFISNPDDLPPNS